MHARLQRSALQHLKDHRSALGSQLLDPSGMKPSVMSVNSRSIMTKYNTVPNALKAPVAPVAPVNTDTFMSAHVTLDKQQITKYLTRKNQAYKELVDKVLVCECPLCPKATYGRNDNQWKQCIFVTGGYHCLRCGSKGSFFEFKKQLGDQPDIVSAGGMAGTNGASEAAVAYLNHAEVSEWISSMPTHESILSYLTKDRGLTREVLEAYHVGAKKHNFPNNTGGWTEHDCIVFPWTLADSQTDTSKVRYTRAKLRSLQDKASMRLLPRGGDWGFFGWHLVPMDAKEIVITEGEFDAMSVFQATGIPAISLPNGCRSLPPQLQPCLERFEKITLWLDDDIPGHEAVEQMTQKLGVSRVCIVTGGNGAKDANDALLKGLDIDMLVSQAQPLKHRQITNFTQIRHEVERLFTDPDMHVGVPYENMPQLQSLMKGHRRGELTIITGATGVGKTTILSQQSLESAMQGVHTLWGSFEIRNPRLARTMMKQYAAQLGVALNEYHNESFAFVADRFEDLPFHFLKFYGSSPVEEVIDAMDYAVYVHDVQHIILDNLQFMQSGQARGNGDKFDMQDRAIEAFRQFASQRNVHVTVVIHPRKEADNSSLGLASVFGSAKATQEADNVQIIQPGLPKTVVKPLNIDKGSKPGHKPDLGVSGGFDDPITGEIINTYFRTLELRKNRWDGDLGSVPMRFDKPSGRLFELTSEDVQTGLVDFIEKQRQLKQLNLLKHMSQHESQQMKSNGFSSPNLRKVSAEENQPNPNGSPKVYAQQQVKPSAASPNTITIDITDIPQVVEAVVVERVPVPTASTPPPPPPAQEKSAFPYTLRKTAPLPKEVNNATTDEPAAPVNTYNHGINAPITPPRMHSPSLDIICE